MEKYKHERAAAEFEGDAGSIAVGAPNEAGMARRNFVGRFARWSAALAVVGLGPDAWMQAVSKGGFLSSAVAAGPTRNRQLHPFPSDDPFNMPLGVNAWYAPADDLATRHVTASSYTHININNGTSHPIYFPTIADPVHTLTCLRGSGIESYISEENVGGIGAQLQEILQLSAVPSDHGKGYTDRHLHIMPPNKPNDLVETFTFVRDGGNNSGQTTADCLRIVRNRLDHYSFNRGRFAVKLQNPLANRGGTRAWGGSALVGLIRKHEVTTANPHIPHALPLILNANRSNPSAAQLGRGGQGNASSPLFHVEYMFPATERDGYGYPDSQGNCRMGMRFALPPSHTDAWIEANAPLMTTTITVDGVTFRANIDRNPWQIALAKAMRDYGMIVVDSGPTNTLSGEPGIPGNIENAIVKWAWISTRVRRVGGKMTSGGAVVHNPQESHWDTWRANGEGWGGGAPRLPYSPPLSGDLPPAYPTSPTGIQVTGARTFDGTG